MDDRIRSNDKLAALQYTQQTVRKYHPYKMILIFSLFGIATLFLGLSMAYLFSKDPSWPKIDMPSAFYISTLVLLMSSALLQFSNYCFQKDWCDWYRISIFGTFLLSIAFISFQYIGWMELKENGINLQSNITGSYLYLISGLHALHVLVGIIFFGGFLAGSYRFVSHPATALVYFTDPVKKLRLQLVTIYWHFMDVIWIYLFLFFLFSNI